LPKADRNIAIVAGTGRLPELLALKIAQGGGQPTIVSFESIPLEWPDQYTRISAEFEKPGHIFRELKRVGCDALVFAGAMQRPVLNLWSADWKFWTIAAKLLPALKGGDDGTLRTVISLFEKEGLEILSPQQIDTSLLASGGVLTKAKPSKQDKADVARAEIIADAIGAVDVGQGAVVANGLCLACETIQGTNAMLAFVAATAGTYRPDGKARGVLFKGPKPRQDLRIDMPTIGPETVEKAHEAGLAGIAVHSDFALLVDRQATLALADKLGLFVWAKPNSDD
jgi:DUF1009 family protein